MKMARDPGVSKAAAMACVLIASGADVSSVHADGSVRPLKLTGVYQDQRSASGECMRGKARDGTGHEPSASGRHPLFIYLTGTTLPYDAGETLKITEEMAKRGFVAISLGYDNGAYAYCNGMQQKAHCIFGEERTQSALSHLCKRSNVDCGAGIVVSGFSQGANLASLAKNFDARVRGAYLLGHGHRAGNFMDVTACMEDKATAFGAGEVRSVNAEGDGFFGQNATGVKAQLEVVLGVHCKEDTCLAEDGSGFAMVHNADLKDGKADHCYFFHAADGRCAGYAGFDPAWEKGHAAWALGPSLDWLASRVRKGAATDAVAENAGAAPVTTPGALPIPLPDRRKTRPLAASKSE
jgi:hypothetical protein